MNARNRGGCLATLAALAIVGVATPAGAARHVKGPQIPPPETVGQVFVDHGAFPKVVVIRAGASSEVGNYALLRPKDKIYLKQRTSQVQVQIYGGDTTTLDGHRHNDASHAYLVQPAPPGTEWKKAGMFQLVSLFPHLFDIPQSRPVAPTTPNGPKGAESGRVAPAALLPNRPQTLTVDPGKVLLPVVWDGGTALVRLTRECRLVVAEGTSLSRGFIVLHPSNLVEDEYCLDVWPVDGAGQPDKKAGFTIPVKVTRGEAGLPDEQTGVLAAASELRGPETGRLQGLVDLQREAQTSFKAWAIFRAIASGDDIGEPRAEN